MNALLTVCLKAIKNEGDFSPQSDFARIDSKPWGDFSPQ